MRLKGFAVMVLAVNASCLLHAVVGGPVVNNGTINYGKNQVTLNGSGFEPAKAAPMVRLNGAALVLDSFSNAEVVATLPAKTAAGTYTLTAFHPTLKVEPIKVTIGKGAHKPVTLHMIGEQ